MKLTVVSFSKNSPLFCCISWSMCLSVDDIKAAIFYPYNTMKQWTFNEPQMDRKLVSTLIKNQVGSPKLRYQFELKSVIIITQTTSDKVEQKLLSNIHVRGQGKTNCHIKVIRDFANLFWIFCWHLGVVSLLNNAFTFGVHQTRLFKISAPFIYLLSIIKVFQDSCQLRTQIGSVVCIASMCCIKASWHIN